MVCWHSPPFAVSPFTLLRATHRPNRHLPHPAGELLRYLQDDSARGYKVVEETTKPAEATKRMSLPALRGIKAFMLPPGFPNTVTADYLPYVLWSFPTHVTGWLYRSLTTASLLEGALAIHIARIPSASRPALTRTQTQGWA